MMPIYVYEIVDESGAGGQRFEVMQRIADEKLTQHPETGEPVRRVITAPNIIGKHSSASEKAVLSDKSLAKHGFTKYERTGDGTYDRTAGTQGPKTLTKP